MPESLYGAHPKKLAVLFKLPSHLDLLRFQGAKVKDRSRESLHHMGVRHFVTVTDSPDPIVTFVLHSTFRNFAREITFFGVYKII